VGEPIQQPGCSNAIIDRPMPPVPLGNFGGVLQLHAWSPLRQSLARADVLRAAASPHCLAASPKLLVRLTETLCQVVAGTIRPVQHPGPEFFSSSLKWTADAETGPWRNSVSMFGSVASGNGVARVKSFTPPSYCAPFGTTSPGLCTTALAPRSASRLCRLRPNTNDQLATAFPCSARRALRHTRRRKHTKHPRRTARAFDQLTAITLATDAPQFYTKNKAIYLILKFSGHVSAAHLARGALNAVGLVG
jgi:hypothetical protein